MLRSLASFSFRHRAVVLPLWLVAAIAVTVAAGSLGGEYADGGRLPGTDSQAALDLYEAQFPDRAVPGQDSAPLVVEDARGLSNPDVVATIESVVDRLEALDGVESVTSPLAAAGRVSDDGTIGLGEVVFDPDDPTVVENIGAIADDVRASGTNVDFANFWFQEGELPASEAWGLLAAAVVLLIAFGSVVAMGLPIVTALIGVVIGVGTVALWAAALDTPDFSVQVAAMMGLGVGIDYSLFIVTRYRDQLRRHGDFHRAAVEAIDTAGRAVVFAGSTVMVSLLGMFLMGLPFLYGLAASASTAVLVAVVAAVTLVPALLGIIGRRIDRWSLPHRRTDRETVWHRWSRFVQRRAGVCALAGFGVLLALSAPVLSMRLASADLGNDPEGTTTRTAYDHLAEGFGAGVNGPLLVVTPTAEGAPSLAAALERTEGVAAVLPAQLSPLGGAVVTVIPVTGPQDEATTALVHRLRDVSIPSSGVDAHVGGQTAADVDFADHLSSRLPIFIGSVLAFSFLLLMMVFRSVLVPLKAVVLNLLSIGAAYGVMVMVFQWGWMGSLLGVSGGAPIEPWAPMLLFAIVFGLSMDYEVFLLSSIRERYDRGMDNSSAVVEGLAATGRVITAAAVIMVFVFGSFVVGDLRAIKLIGLGLSVAVLVDATIVRMLLVPATMELLGDRNWWMPKSLGRVLPRLGVERQLVEVS